MDASILRDLLEQAVGVGRFQLGQHPVIQHALHDGVLCAQLLQYVGVRRIAALSFLDRRQSEAVKKDLAQHFGGIDVEFLARVAVDRRLRLLDPLGKHLPEGQKR